MRNEDMRVCAFCLYSHIREGQVCPSYMFRLSDVAQQRRGRIPLQPGITRSSLLGAALCSWAHDNRTTFRDPFT